MSPQEKSSSRWEQFNIIVDVMISRLSTRQALAVVVMFRHADVNRRLKLSASQLAKALGTQIRNARKVLTELEQLGVIRTIEPRRGTIPTTYEITGAAPRQPPKRKQKGRLCASSNAHKSEPSMRQKTHTNEKPSVRHMAP